MCIFCANVVCNENHEEEVERMLDDKMPKKKQRIKWGKTFLVFRLQKSLLSLDLVLIKV